MTLLKAYAGVIISFLVIDAVWIAFVAKPLYERSIGHLLRESPSLFAAGVFYLAYAAGVVVLACRSAWSASSAKVALVNGAVLGALAYGTFTVTNFALLEGWTVALVVSDVPWGAALTAVTAWVGYIAGRK